MIVFSLNVIKKRLSNLEIILPSIIKQSDILYVNLIGYIESPYNIPNILINDKIIINKLGDVGSEYRFYNYNDCVDDTYYFTIDDDILYPLDYSSIMINNMVKYNNDSICCVHFSTLISIENDNLYKNDRIVYNFKKKLNENRKIMIPGVGTSCFYKKNHKLNINSFKTPNMSDPYVAHFAKIQNVDIYAVKREELWLKPLNEYNSSIFGNSPYSIVDKLLKNTFKTMNNNNNNNIVFLVTGGAGFIGSNLCEYLLDEGYKVRCLDNLSSGSQENVDIFIDNPNYEFINSSITDFNTCLNATKGVDYVLHQAAMGSIPRSIEYPLYYDDVNIKGMLNMLEASRQNNVKRFVYASSSSVYGDELTSPKVEGCEGNLLSPYALTKRTNEEYAKLYTKLYGLETCGLRYFNVFGKRQSPNGAYAAVIPKFIKLLLDNKQPIIYGDGLQSRDFTYIKNVIEANIKACLTLNDIKGNVFNIAYSTPKKIIFVYQTLNNLLGKAIKPIYKNDRIGDVKNSNADITKAKRMLDYNPSWSFKRGIEDVIDWYKLNNK